MMENRKNVPLIVALSIPVLMIALIAISIYFPALFVSPKFDFVYSTDNEYCRFLKYSVKVGKIIENEKQPANENNICRDSRDPRLYYYDVTRKISREITFEEAQKLTLDNAFQSPDGFEVVSGDRSFDVFFIGGSSYYDKYLKKGSYSRKLNIPHNYYYDFRLIGWVKEANHG